MASGNIHPFQVAPTAARPVEGLLPVASLPDPDKILAEYGSKPSAAEAFSPAEKVAGLAVRVTLQTATGVWPKGTTFW